MTEASRQALHARFHLSRARYHLRDTRVLTGLVLSEGDALDRRL
jgi:hypothetical protein